MLTHSQKKSLSARIMYAWEDFDEGTASIYISAYLTGSPLTRHGIPFLFHILKDEFPTGLCLIISSAKAAKGDIVSIVNLSITHSPKNSYSLVQPEKPRETSLEFRSNHGKEGGRKPYYLVQINFPEVIRHRSSFEVFIKGDILRKDGPEPFEQTLKLKYIRNIYIYPGWFALLLMSA